MRAHYQVRRNTGEIPVAPASAHFSRYSLRASRWMVTADWFLFLLAALLVGSSLLASWQTDAWHWLQRSGALMVSIGAVLSTRRPLGLILEGLLAEPASPAPPTIARDSLADNATELRTCICGFGLVAMGTAIWAYGDLLGCPRYGNLSCLT